MTTQIVTANEIIIDALQKLGVYAPGETPTDADMSIGLAQLNDLVDDWLADSIYLFKVIEIGVPIKQGMQDYTVGPGGMADVPRPFRVIMGRGVAKIETGANVGSGVDSVSALEWNAIYAPANNISNATVGTPIALYYEPQYPLALLSVSPLPSSDGTLLLPSFYGLSDFAALTTQYTMAPGQEQGLKANLAIALNPYFGGTVVSPELAMLAQQTKTTLYLMNSLSRAIWKRDRELPARVGLGPARG